MKIALRRLLAATILFVAAALPASADLPPVHVDGPNLTAGGKVLRLRGIDWGWWHLSATRYTEDDMRQQAAWGANVVRLVFSYTDLEDRATPGKWREDGFEQFDQVIQWAKKYNQYVILDMHVCPGGQDPSPYEDGGENRFWSDEADQDNYAALWAEIARRYRDRPEVMAYELMNEPDSRMESADALVRAEQKGIDAIRAVDSDKVIVATGDHYSGPASLVDAVKLADPNILYTFHFYIGSAQTAWLKNLTDGPGLSGTRDWTRLEQTFTMPGNATDIQIMLRSSGNSGTAWFDDVSLTDDAGKTLYAGGFDKTAKPFVPERSPAASMQYDSNVGHLAPGSLRVSGTPDYNGWSGPQIALQAGKKYRLTAWVRLENATGNSYLTCAFLGPSSPVPDFAQLRNAMEPAVAFAQKYRVPVWVGEFGCGAVNPAYQKAWVKTCISMFEEAGFDWTYWNYKETTGPRSMALEAERADSSNYPVNAPLLAALQSGWSKNNL